MAQLTNAELQSQILNNLFQALKTQSEKYLDIVNDSSYSLEDRKTFEKELSDINTVLTELSGKSVNYTVVELDNLLVKYSEKMLQIDSLISNLNVNTLNISFDSLTPSQKEFLKGAKGDKGEKGDIGLTGATGKDFTFDMFTLQQLLSLKGDKGEKGDIGLTGATGKDFTFDMFTPQQLLSLKGDKGEKGDIGLTGATGKDFTFDMFTPQQLLSLKGDKGEKGDIGLTGAKGLDGKFEDLTQSQMNSLIDYFAKSQSFVDLLQRITNLEASLGSSTPIIQTAVYSTEFNQFSLIVTKNDKMTPYFVLFDYVPINNDVLTLQITETTTNQIFNAEYNILVDSSSPVPNMLQVSSTPSTPNDRFRFNCFMNPTPKSQIYGGFELIDSNNTMSPIGISYKVIVKLIRGGEIYPIGMLSHTNTSSDLQSWLSL